jgi:D-glucosaminate-6-phosphate ammonia-lyase
LSHPIQRLNLTNVINVSGTMTSLGASRVLPSVVEDVADILGRFVKMSELHARSSQIIARLTGAQAGVITSSSSAAITLSVAAAMVGDDLAAIEALPSLYGREHRVALQMGHMINYGGVIPQAIEAAGAQVVPLGTACLCETYHLEAAIAQGLAAAVYVVSHHTVRMGELPMDVFIDICRKHNVPVIIDMASEYDLTTAIALGADAVIWSGHKFLSGVTSGIIAGNRQMMRATYLQNRGLGRLMKVGKEGIVGAISALEAWETLDHAAQSAREAEIVQHWMQTLSEIPGVNLERHQDWTLNPIIRVQMTLKPELSRLWAWELSERLMAGNPAIAVRDDLSEHQLIYLDPCNSTLEEAKVVSDVIRQTFENARHKGDGCKISWSDEKRKRGLVSTPWFDEVTKR